MTCSNQCSSVYLGDARIFVLLARDGCARLPLACCPGRRGRASANAFRSATPAQNRVNRYEMREKGKVFTTVFGPLAHTNQSGEGWRDGTDSRPLTGDARANQRDNVRTTRPARPRGAADGRGACAIYTRTPLHHAPFAQPTSAESTAIAVPNAPRRLAPPVLAAQPPSKRRRRDSCTPRCGFTGGARSSPALPAARASRGGA